MMMASMRTTAGIHATMLSLVFLTSATLVAQGDGAAPEPLLRWRDPMFLTGPGAQIGASFRNLTPSEAKQARSESSSVFFDYGGAVIEQVSPDSPALRAGLLKGDRITMFDGHRVRNASEFSRLVEETPPGWTVTMTVVRDRKLLKLSITPSYVTAHRIGAGDGRGSGFLGNF
jgi:membrane-associated protease RseP (regulator of RpoE activity)